MPAKTASEVWLIDVSGSMIEDNRYIKMKVELARLYASAKGVKLLAFATEVTEVDSIEKLPQPNGSTDLTRALEAALEYFPGRVFVASDGIPNSMDTALVAAQALPGIVNGLFYGDETNREAIAFMEKLSRDNGGKFVSKDIGKGESLLCSEVREMLGLPAPIAL